MSRHCQGPVIAAAILAMILIAGPAEPASADQDDPRLKGLFERLQTTSNPVEARAVEQRIWRVWLEADDASVNRLMQQGIVAMRDQRYATALQAFDRMVEQAPEFAEGWNKRATVHFLMGNWQASVRDIQQTLALEPRHFGALFGLGLIYDALEQPEAALRSFEATLALNPHSESTRQMVEELQRQVRGSPT
ncbi:MAG TPA: tetratricopeptide repeat protein [Geminicoccaceae bacterium]